MQQTSKHNRSDTRTSSNAACHALSRSLDDRKDGPHSVGELSLVHMDARPVLIFDGDDTLWKTMPLYSQAKRNFFHLMRSQGFATKEVEAYFEERDRTNVKTLGFSRRRFGLSMLQTYRHFSRLARRPLRKSVDTRITTIRDQ